MISRQYGVWNADTLAKSIETVLEIEDVRAIPDTTSASISHANLPSADVVEFEALGWRFVSSTTFGGKGARVFLKNGRLALSMGDASLRFSLGLLDSQRLSVINRFGMNLRDPVDVDTNTFRVNIPTTSAVDVLATSVLLQYTTDVVYMEVDFIVI
jgi:hypothetical protein